ncbi:hypothetical protein [Actinomadura sp. 3N407]|uniref:hypothetical protein n=1 Tax=Actinomadura sp. 3N407 TaxID=3457423 RepID=UPI003FCE7A95
MCEAQAVEYVTARVRAMFHTDVGEASIGDTELFEAAARLLGREADTEQEIAGAIADIAADIDDGLADWLAESADAPCGWVYSQGRNRV